MPKLIRITTVPMALRYLLRGQMQYMQTQGYDVIMVSADGKEREDVMAYEGCRHIIIPMTRKITPFKDLSCLFKLIKLFKKEKPDIVHTHTPKAGLLGMLAAKFAGVKVRIHTVAGMPLMVEKGFKRALLKRIEKITYASATQVWPNSVSLFNYIKEHRFCRNKKLKVIGKGSSNGIDLGRFDRSKLDANILEQVKTTLQYDASRSYLLCIGRLVKDKGIAELVDAFTGLQPDYPALRLVLAGQFETELDPLPAATLETIKNNPGIIHIDWTPYVEYYLALANFFVFPSHREGFPNVLLQAGALKTAIICSAIPGNIDIVQHGRTGLSFPAGDKDAISEQISVGLGHKADIIGMRERLYRYIDEHYQQEHIWQAICLEYSTLLNK